MITKHRVEKAKPQKRFKSTTHEEEYTEYVWGMIGRVRSGIYKVKHIDSVVEEVQDKGI